MASDRIRERKTDQLSVRLDPSTRRALEELKKEYGFDSDADAIRGTIIILKNKETLLSEIEGRLTNRLMTLFEGRLNEIFQSEEFKELILNVVVDELNKETGRFGH